MANATGPLINTGITPGGNIGQELSYITRRGFLDKMTVQIYNASPTLAAHLANAQSVSGGINPITEPVQGNKYTTPAAIGYDGSFSTGTIGQGAYNAMFNLKGTFCPIPFLGMEAMVQINYAVIRRIEAVMNDATNGMIDFLSTAWFSNVTNNLEMIGYYGAIDDGTNLQIYGGLDRTSYTWWQALAYDASSATPTRNLILQYIVGTVKNCGEKPTFGVMSPGTWNLLAQDFTADERYIVTGTESYADNQFGARAAFQALMVAGVPIYMDPRITTDGTLYLFNENYGALYVHDDAAFAFTGFHSTMANSQLGYIGGVLLLSEFVCTKPKANTVVTNLLYTTL